MKKLTKVLSLVLVVAMIFGLGVIGAGATYTDSDKITPAYAEAAEIMTDLGVITGTGAGAFNPTGTLTRAEAAVILAKVTLGAQAQYLAPTTKSFKDVATSHWAYKYIEYCVTAGLLSGTGNDNFSPNAQLSGYQWALMLMRARGVNPDDYNISGANWAINTATAYYGAAKFSNVAISGAVMTREAAIQMAYDAAFTGKIASTGYPVYFREYKSGVFLADVLVGTYPTLTDAAAAVTALNGASGFTANDATGSHYRYGATSVDLSTKDCLAKTVFGVTKAPGVTRDHYGRPSSSYTVDAYTAIKNVTVGNSYGWTNATKTVSVAPVATFTTAVTATELQRTLGANATLIANASTVSAITADSGKIFINGAKSTSNVTVNTNTQVLGGAGIVTEIYATATANQYVVVQIQPTLAKVTSVTNTAATRTTGAYTTYTIAGTQYNVYTSTVSGLEKTELTVNGTIAKGDFVMIYGVSTTAGSKEAVAAPATVVAGKLTGYTSSTNSYTIGGTSYVKSAAAINGSDATAISAFNTDASYAVDTYGNVVGAVTVSVPNNYLFVLKTENVSYLNTVTNKVESGVEATVITVDGTLSTVKVKAAAASDIDATNGGNQTVGLFTYTVEANTGKYIMEIVSNQNKPATINKTPVLDSGLYANGATKYFAAVENTDGVYTSVTAYTGYAAVALTVPTNAAAIDANGDGIAEVVFVDVTSETGVTASYVYLTGSFTSDGTNYVYDAIVAGEATTMKLASGLTAGLYTVTAGAATPVTGTAALNVSAGTDGKYGSTSFFGYNNGLLMTGSAAGATNTYMAAIGATVPVYTFENGVCTVSTADGLSDTNGTMVIITVNAAKTAISAVYVIK